MSLFLAFLWAFAPAQKARAQDAPAPLAAPSAEQRRYEQDMRRMTREAEAARRRMFAERRKSIERLKESDPKLYAQELAEFQDEQTLQDTLSAYRDGKLTEKRARVALKPVAKARAKQEYRELPEKIKRLKAELAFSQQALGKPSLLGDRLLDQWLRGWGPPPKAPAPGQPFQPPSPPETPPAP